MTLNATVTGRDDLTDARYQIATDAGPQTVNGCVFGEFGLHPASGALVLSHLPTGRVLDSFRSWGPALQAMAESRGRA
ncbi:hypothetical protein ABNQ39_00365 (plasmid) [Azospirillum sp. A26]|uniref:hypothetical protein n=1 Tax=Azospirillum sp. A26 TaxID=3160607 RepID=UPI00366BC6D6